MTTDPYGIFNVMLGKFVAIGDNVFNGDDRWLGIQVDQESETTPRQQIGSAAYAVYAHKSGDSDMLGGFAANVYGVVKREVVAYGIVDGSNNCTRDKGHHFSSRRIIVDNDPTCEITVRDRNDVDVSYDLNKYVTVVTPIRNPTCNFAQMTTTGSRDGKLLVDIYDANGGHRDCKFHFLTFAFTDSGQPD